MVVGAAVAACPARAAAPLFEEHFCYPAGSALNGQGGWSASGSAGVNPITIGTPGLAFPGYCSSTCGLAGTTANTGEDLGHLFAGQASGSVYAAFLLNVVSSQMNGDYCLSFFDGALALNTALGRVTIRKDPGSANYLMGVQFGGTAAAIYTPSTYALGTTHLVVLKYTFMSAGGNNDEVALIVDPVIGGSEPAASAVATDPAQADAVNLDAVGIRQGGANRAPTVQLDGIRVATSWSDVFGGSNVTASAAPAAGGSISPAGVVQVPCAGTQVFTIAPSDCYMVADVQVDGVSVGPVGSYTFTNSDVPNHTIVASFSPLTYTLTAAAGTGGSISILGAVVVPCGSDMPYTIVADACMTTGGVLVDGNPIGAVGSYTFANVHANHSISASFVRPLTAITPPDVTPLVCGSTGNLLCASLPNAASEDFVSLLRGGLVVPPNGSPAFGHGSFTLDSLNVLHYSLMHDPLVGGAIATHLHGPAPAGVNAGSFASLPLGDFVSGQVLLTPLQVSYLRGGLVYVDVHSPTFPLGELRGQLQPTRTIHWSVSSLDPTWAITGGQGTSCITYTAGVSGGALFKVVATGSSGCRDSSMLALGCGALTAVDLPREPETRFRDVTPNPMRGSTRIDYALVASGPMTIEVFSLSGQRVRLLATGLRAAGSGSVMWDGRSESGARLAAGAYVVRLATSGTTLSRKVVLLR